MPASEPVIATLIKLCEEILSTTVRAEDDLFADLAVGSLVIVRIAVAIENQFGWSPQLTTFEEARTIGRLAAIIQTNAQTVAVPTQEAPLTNTDVPRSIYPLRPSGNQPPLFLVRPASRMSGALAYVGMVRHIEPERPIYVFQNRPFLENCAPYQSIEEMSLEYLSALRTVQPKGPYLLGGWCLGGKAAFEMANRLVAEGEQVNQLFLFDTPAPSNDTDQSAFLTHRERVREDLLAYGRGSDSQLPASLLQLLRNDPSLLSRFEKLAYFDYQNNDPRLIDRVFPGRFEFETLRRMPVDAMWELVYANLKSTEASSDDDYPESAVNFRRGVHFLAQDHQIEMLYKPKWVYPGKVTMLLVRGGRVNPSHWCPFLSTAPKVLEFGMHAIDGDPSPHNSLMEDESLRLMSDDLNQLLREVE